jgi:ribosomal protein L13E
VNEPTSHVELEIQRRIEAQRIKVQAARERRQSLAEARKAGLARRHAAKLAHLAESERRAAEQQQDDEPDDQNEES